MDSGSVRLMRALHTVRMDESHVIGSFHVVWDFRSERESSSPDGARPDQSTPPLGHHGGVTGNRASWERLGGSLGTHAGRFTGWWRLERVLILLVTSAFLVSLVMRQPCFADQYSQNPSGPLYHRLCYSDIPILFRTRGFAQGQLPYFQSRLEYPVGTGLAMEFTALTTRVLFGSNMTSDRASVDFYGVNIVFLFIVALVAVLAFARLAGPGRSHDALMVAAAPSLVLTATINWDLIPVALAVLALLAWAKSHPLLAGALLGLGGAAKLWPIFLLGPLFLLSVRARRTASGARAIAGAITAWLTLNLPVFLLARTEWLYFWRYSSTRGGDPNAPNFGSPWFALQLSDHPVADADRLAVTGFVILCVAIMVLIFAAKVRPRVGQVTFLTIAAFTVTGTVYSPQYVLWLLPLAVLARPVWRDILIWQTAELLYWLAIWWYLSQALLPGGPSAIPMFYVLAIAVRLAGQVYFAVMVVRDVLHPESDRVRLSADFSLVNPCT